MLDPIACTLGYIQSLVFRLASGLGSALNQTLRLSVVSSDTTVLQDAWDMIRSFANMFFIIGLVIMAFGTIFGLSGFNFRRLIANFLIAALLINFSFAIGTVIINTSQSISNIFLNSIGDLGARIATATKLGEMVAGKTAEGMSRSYLAAIPIIGPGLAMRDYFSSTPSETLVWGETQLAFMNIIFGSIMVFSLGVAVIFSLIRIPILWFLLIVSPVAWICMILPSTQKVNRLWWSYFIKWNTFLPIYLFFMYFGAYFLSNGANVIAQANINSETTLLGFGVSLQIFFYFILVGIFLIGGAKIAMSGATAGSAGVMAAGIWGKQRTMARFAGGGLARVTGVTATSDAGKDRWKQFVNEGFMGTRFENSLGKIYSGKEGMARRQAAVGESFGVRGAAQTQMTKDVEAEKQRLRTNTDTKDLKKRTSQGSDYQRIAAYERLSELRDLDDKEVLDVYNLYGSDGSANARKFIEKIDPKKFDKTQRDNLYTKIGDMRFKQKISLVRAERGDFTDINDFVFQSTKFTTEEDRAEYARKAKDYIERLNPTDRSTLYDHADVRGEMKRAIALIRADKDAKLSEDELKNMTALFETSSQKENLLLKAQEKNLVASLRVRRDMGLLRQREDGTGPEDYQTALTREVGKLSNEQILKSSKQTLIDPEFSETLKSSLVTNPKRISSILRSPNASAEDIEGLKELFSKVEKEALTNDKIKPLDKLIARAKGLANEVTSARTAKDAQKITLLADESKRTLKKAEKLVNDVYGSEIADENIRGIASAKLLELKSIFESLKRSTS